MSLRHAILGFLALRPLTGYDLKKYFDASVQHFWSADQAQIYRTLNQLHRDGLAEVVAVAQDGRPDRKEHHITAAGRGELDAWLAAPDEPPPVHEPFLLKLFFAGRLPAAGRAALLDARIAAAAERLEVLRAIAGQSVAALQGPDAADRVMAAATLENGIRHVAAELDWLRDLRADLEGPSPAAERLSRRLARLAEDGPRDLPEGAS
ncbi:PadR family transcriptional regulator [Dactylosporangium sp. CA-139066]|uniref:PadR family transcriptional regulator n=1 Tax=Dactylosporangium sp. CA-139066 TaxID=3239930 RepID=UPI003D8DA08D